MWFDTAKTLNWYNSVNILATEMKHISLESSQQDELNGGSPFGESTVDRCNLSFDGMSLILVYANQIVPFHLIF